MAHLTKSQALRHLQRTLNEIPKLIDSNQSFKNGDPLEFTKWHTNAIACIKNVFPGDTHSLQEFDLCFIRRNIPDYLDKEDSEYRHEYVAMLQSAASFFESKKEEVDIYWTDTNSPSTSNLKTNENSKSDKVFVIHGRDEKTKNEVAKFLSQIGLEPIILSEQPSEGKTIIEKFERHSDVGFAVALLTPDDLGSERSQREQMFRARQNVVFELGFFVGKLGRERVCALTKDPNIEIPSDYSGVAYIDLRQVPAWRSELVRELECAGLDVDTSKI